ncbi:AAA family ATPase [Chloroflexota bacterium]
MNIAVAGKGGTGKTSITGLVLRYLLNQGLTPVLAVDADANANLAYSLGLEVRKTIGSIIANFNEEKIHIPQGMTKEAYLEIKIHDAITETKGLDLLTMGRGEGAECYCYPNLLLRKFTDSLMDNYAYTLLDNEAGMEHLSRRTTQNIDELFLISNHSIKGVRTIANLIELVKELKIVVKRQSVIINVVPDGKLDPAIQAEMDRIGITPTALIPADETITNADLQMQSLLELPDSAPAVKAVNEMMEKLNKTRQN